MDGLPVKNGMKSSAAPDRFGGLVDSFRFALPSFFRLLRLLLDTCEPRQTMAVTANWSRITIGHRSITSVSWDFSSPSIGAEGVLEGSRYSLSTSATSFLTTQVTLETRMWNIRIQHPTNHFPVVGLAGVPIPSTRHAPQRTLQQVQRAFNELWKSVGRTTYLRSCRCNEEQSQNDR